VDLADQDAIVVLFLRGPLPSRRKLSRVVGRRRARYLALGGLLGAAGVGSGKAQRFSFNPVAAAVSSVMAERGTELELTTYRAGFHSADWDIPNVENERIDYWVDRFQNVPEMREKMEGFLERSGRYVPMISEKLAQRGMPQDLVFLAMIESGFQPGAASAASAVGIWQFIPETARRHGLRVDRFVDERRDPEKATDAALEYLSTLYDRFGSWYLAAAAYNSGENRVGRVMRETHGSERASAESAYYEISEKLPAETRDYVPLMMAAGRIVKDLEGHGFLDVVPDGPEVFDEVMAEPDLALADLAESAGVPLEALQDLNPHLLQARTPPNESYPVRVPVGASARVALALDQL
jgi:membrane-bound lytic murein transglycosylase D